MTMVRLTEAQRAVPVQAFPAVAHLGIGGLVLGQFLREPPFSIQLALGGMAVWIVLVGVAVFLARKRQ